MSNTRQQNAVVTLTETSRYEPGSSGSPERELQHLQQERDDLLRLHEALGEVERAPTLHDRLRVFVEAIRRIGFGRVSITLRDADLNATEIVTAGLSPDEDAMLRRDPQPGDVWRRRLAAIERFRISNSYYLDGRDSWVAEEFGGGLVSQMEPTGDAEWSPRDSLLVPLRSASGAVVATLVMDDPADHLRPTLTRVRTVELFAQQLTATLEHASLMALAEQRARRLSQLHQLGLLLARTLDEPTILRELAQQVEQILPVRTVVILGTDNAGVPWPRVLHRDGAHQDEMFTPVSVRAVAAEAAKGQQAARDGSMCAVPAVLGSTTVAVIVVETKSGDALLPADADLLSTIATQAAAAISNARLYADSVRQRRQTEALADVARAVSESLRIDRVLQLILRHATALLRTDGATIALFRGDTLEVTAGVGVGRSLIGSRIPIETSLVGRAVRSATSIIRHDVQDDSEVFSHSVAAAQIRNIIIVPLLSVQGPVGALSVFNRLAPFTDDDAEVLQRLADQVAVAVVNARLFEEVAEVTREWAVAFDSIGSGMVVLDRQGNIQRSNARARTLMHEATETALVGQPFHKALFGESAPCEECVHFAAMRDEAVKRSIHHDQLRGRVFDITAAPHPLGGAVVTFDDVTEHRALAERYRRVVETTGDAIVMTDLDRRIAFANPAALALLGRGEELIGMPTALVVPDDQLANIQEHELRGLAGEPQSYEGVVLRPDGERRLVSINTAPLRELGEVTGVVATLRDITDERRARDAVVQSETRYRNLFDSASDAIYTLDPHGSFTSANQATAELTGRAQDELLGHPVGPMIHEEDADLVAGHFRGALHGHAIRYECRLLRPNGERRIISVTNTPIRRDDTVVGVLGVARDVTEARARAAALTRSEARYTRLVESASDAIFTVDEQGRFTAVNRSLEHAAGRPREALLGARFADIVDPRDLPAAERLLREAYDGQRSRGAVRYLAADGSARHGSVIMSPVLEETQITGALGILRDVTDEQRLAEQLLQQEKLVAVGQLVSGVAHELNNPLAGVMAFAQLILAMPDAVEGEPRQFVEIIHREAKRAAKIVSNLLTFARQQPAERQVTRLNEIVADTLELRRYGMRSADIEVTLALDETLPETWADPFQLQQVILNLVTNAEQALADTQGARHMRIRTFRDGPRLVLSVSDNGPGIARDQLDRIFNPFFTTKPVGQGTGLGLSISDGIIREHGGRIRVESSPGAGAVFIVELPHVLPPTEIEMVVPRVHGERTGVRRMLVVDDEAAMRAAVSGFLKSLGHDVHVAPSGVLARALLEKNEYDVILLDLRMADVGGEMLYRELCIRDPKHARRVVFVTGDLQSEKAQQFLNEAGRPVIGKPFQLDDLVEVIDTVAR